MSLGFSRLTVFTIVWAASAVATSWELNGRSASAQEAEPTQGSATQFRDTFENFKKGVKEHNGLFLLNGYWLSEEELREKYGAPAAASEPWVQSRGLSQQAESRGAAKSPGADPRIQIGPPELSLNVNIVDGQLDYWADPSDRLLTYAIVRSSMTDHQYGQLKQALGEATADWEKACPQCGIKFEHKNDLDGGSEADLRATLEAGKIRFLVLNERDNLGLSSSFFPSSPIAQRLLVVGPGLFESQIPAAGALRHNLGHILGYRHEHISPEAPSECHRESPNYMTGAYDPISIMHYPCGGAGPPEWKLSAGDKLSHQTLYGDATVQVEIEGQDVLSKATSVLRILKDQKYSRLTYLPYDVATPDGCVSYIKALGLETALEGKPAAPTRSCYGFAALRKTIDGKPHQPIVLFSSYVDVATGSASYADADRRKYFEDLQARVAPLKYEAVDSPEDSSVSYKLAWRKYRVTIPVAGIEQKSVSNAIRALSKRDPSIASTLGQSIDKALATESMRVKNSVETQNFTDPEAVCKSQAPMRPYALLQNSKFTFEEFAPESGALVVPDLACDRPSESPFKESCDNCPCGSVGCEHCVCDPERRPKPEVFLVDKNMDRTALKMPASGSSNTTPNNNTCKSTPLNNEIHHGTLMAQIVAGWNRFVGFVPGVEPKLVQSNNLDPSFIKDLAPGTEHLEDPPPGVVVLTSQFCYTEGALEAHAMKGVTNGCEIGGDDRPAINDEGRRSKNEKELIEGHPATNRIRSLGHLLWVAAIGQPDGAEPLAETSEPTTFQKHSIALPIALANEQMVLLVSACEKCSTTREARPEARKLWKRAYRGVDSVRAHIMAPGGLELRIPTGSVYAGGIPGFGTRNELTQGYGTSQAAAFAAEVASKMLTCYPRHYENGNQLKRALQISSAPVYDDDDDDDDDDDAKFIATGLLDVQKALRHPAYVHISERGGGEDYKRIRKESAKWCQPVIRFKRPNEEIVDIESWKIRRIVRVQSGPDRWIVYYLTDKKAVVRSPLVTSVDGEPPKGLLNDGDNTYSFKNIQDFLAFDTLSFGTCS